MIKATAITSENSNGITTSKIPQLEKVPTGIRGFDQITFGGIPKNRPTILVGATGTGKTFMSMEYIIKGAVLFNETVVFMTFEEKTSELLINATSLGYDLKYLVQEKKIFLEHLNINNNEIHEAGKYNIEGLFVMLELAINKVNAKRVVLDSFDTLFSNFDTRILRSEFKRLFFWLKEKKVTAIITAELGDTFLTRLGLEENVADCVIELTNRVINQIGTRRIKVIKYRGSSHSNNEYPFVIDENGMTIFPIVNQLLEQQTSNKRISSGIPTLDEVLENKGFFLGSSILISGTAGTGKTLITISFVKSICEKKITCLFCAFEETPNQIIRNSASIGILLLPLKESGYLHFYFAKPTLQNLELHFMAIKESIEKLKPTIVILDPITNLMTEGPNSEIRSMLTRFIDYLKTKQITVMFTAAITIGSIAQHPSDEGISAMVDTWIMLQDIELHGERNKVLYIMKSRGMSHSNKAKEIIISNNGISLSPFKKNKIESFNSASLPDMSANNQNKKKCIIKMEKNYDIEMDFILEELIKEYENTYKGVNFYAEDVISTTNEKVTEKVKASFALKDWEINILYYTLLIDGYLKMVDPLTISLEGLVFRNNGGYVKKTERTISESKKIETIQNDFKKYSFGLMVFTAIVALGTVISAWFFAIEIYKHYFSITQ